MVHNKKLRIRRARSHEADVLTGIALRSKKSNGYDDVFMEACTDELTVTATHIKEGEYWVAERECVSSGSIEGRFLPRMEKLLRQS